MRVVVLYEYAAVLVNDLCVFRYIYIFNFIHHIIW